MKQDQDQDQEKRTVASKLDTVVVDDDVLLHKVRAQLDSDAQALDGETLARLNQARLAATAQLESRGGRYQRWYWAAGPVAACLLLVVVSLQYAPGKQALLPGAELAAISDGTIDISSLPDDDVNLAIELGELDAAQELDAVAMLAEDDALDFYTGLEFFEWLDQQEDAASLLEVEPKTSGLQRFGVELG